MSHGKVAKAKAQLLRQGRVSKAKSTLVAGAAANKKEEEDNFMDRLGAFEGTKHHKSLEGGRDTQAFGIKFSEGLTKKAGEGSKDFAARVVDKHRDKVKKKVGDKEWASLSPGVRSAVLDLKFNVGSLGSKLISAVKTGGDPKSVMLETLDTVRSTMLSDKGDFKKGDKIVSPGLAKRRAAGWNLAFPERKIEEVVFEEKGSRTKVTYLADDGEVFSYSTKGSVSTDFKTKTGDTTIEI